MKLLVSGCSFSVTNNVEDNLLDENKMWVYHPFQPKKIVNYWNPHEYVDPLNQIQLNNKAWSGAGNKYICDSVILSCAEYKPDLVLVMWSGPDRLDFPIRQEFQNDVSGPKGLITYALDNRIRYRLSGGIHGGLSGKDVVTRNLFRSTYVYTSPFELNVLTLLEIIKLQNFLIGIKIPFYFMSFCNFWNVKDLPNETFSMEPLKDNPQIKELIALIDFDKWIFKNENKDGYYEVAKEINSFKPDKFHPGFEASKIWGQIVKDRLVKDKIL